MEQIFSNVTCLTNSHLEIGYHYEIQVNIALSVKIFLTYGTFYTKEPFISLGDFQKKSQFYSLSHKSQFYSLSHNSSIVNNYSLWLASWSRLSYFQQINKSDRESWRASPEFMKLHYKVITNDNITGNCSGVQIAMRYDIKMLIIMPITL